jgi:tRNA A-37 threonylcarbamoyl transferase component Bud32
MSNLDAATTAQLLLKIGLATESQLEEAWDDGVRKFGPNELLLLFMERKGYLTPWQSSKVLKGDTDGFVLGGYKLQYKIQSGSFGRVFCAKDETTGRKVAVKVLRRRWSEDQLRIELFEREGRVGMQLHHPNIVEVLSVGVERKTGQYYIVMEFVEGGNLREILAIQPGRKLDPLKTVKIIEDCASGLHHAFAHGVTHRDMKLTNILIASQGVAKLVDFGLAKIYSALAGSEDKVERTVDYAGLEKATGVKTGDIRSDIYFLGAVLYEVLCGRPPLDMTRDKHARMAKYRFDSVKPLTAADVSGPPSLLRLVETMMELDPARRFQTPSQLLDAIRAVRAELEARENGQGAPRPTGPRPVFVVESDAHLQDAIRHKFKELGYRVLLAGDPRRAIDRFRQQPFDGLVVDARTTGEDGFRAFELIATEAERQGLACGAVLIINQDQADWAKRLKARPGVAVLMEIPPDRTVKLGHLVKKITTLVPPDRGGAALASR